MFEIRDNVLKSFSNTENEKDIVIPDGVKKIEHYCFSKDKSIRSVTMPDSVEEIGNYVFNRCTYLKSVRFSENLKKIGSFAFDECLYLDNVVIPDSVNYIRECAFQGCKRLKSVKLSKGLRFIDYYVFSDCEQLTEITLPESVRGIGDSSFKHCLSLKRVVLNEGLEEICNEAFVNCDNLEPPVIPHTVKVISHFCFDNRIVFSYADKNGFIVVGDNVLIAYSGTKNTVVIPDGVKHIADNAFDTEYLNRKTRLITSITFPDSVESVSKNAVSRTGWYKKLKEEFAVVGNGVLVKYSGKSDIPIVPDNVRVISTDAFQLVCDTIKGIVFPQGLEVIGYNAFRGFRSLEAVSFPDSVREISQGAFFGCLSLKEVRFGKGIEIIGDKAFWFCSRECRVYLPHLPVSICELALANVTLDIKINNRRCVIELNSTWGLEMPFDFIYSPTAENFSELPAAYKLPLSIAFYDKDETILAYLKRNIKKAVKHLADCNDTETLNDVLKTGFVRKSNIDDLIAYTEKCTQTSGSPEFRMILMKYKDEHIGYKKARFSI